MRTMKLYEYLCCKEGTVMIKFNCNADTVEATRQDIVDHGFHAATISTAVVTDMAYGADHEAVAEVMACHGCLPAGEVTEYDREVLSHSHL